MNSTTDDRRVRKTKKALTEGLADLMMEKDLRNITVRELVDKADIHRATFYSHYKDIYDLYEQIENSIIIEITSMMEDASLSDEEFYNAFINYIYDNSKICRMLLKTNNPHNFYNKIGSLLEAKYTEVWVKEEKIKTVGDELKCSVSYHIFGYLSIISHWANDNFSIPKETIIDIIKKIDANFDEFLREFF